MSARTILISRFSAIGDVAMTVPVVYSVCRSNPDVRFVMITRKAMVSMMIERPQNLTVIGVNLKKDYKGVKGLWRLFCELNAQYHFTAFADLHNVLRTRILGLFCRLSGVKVAVLNKARAHRRRLTRRRGKVMLPMTTQRARYREVFYRLGLTVEDRFKSLFGDRRGDPEIFADVTAPKAPGRRWVAIAPFAAHPGKVYPPEMMEKVVASLSKDPSIDIFLFGGGDSEKEILDSWVEKYPSTTSLAGRKLGFGIELNLLSWMDAMVSMDSANMHLAALVDVPVVAVWGATHPYCGFRAFHQSDANAVQLAMTCRPCSVFGNKPCHRGDYHCLRGISPQAIIDRVESIIEKSH